MMIDKYRVHDVAKDLNVANKDVIDLLNIHSEGEKKHMTALSEEELDVIFENFTQKNQVRNFDEYYASKNQKPLPKSEVAEVKSTDNNASTESQDSDKTSEPVAAKEPSLEKAEAPKPPVQKTFTPQAPSQAQPPRPANVAPNNRPMGESRPNTNSRPTDAQRPATFNRSTDAQRPSTFNRQSDSQSQSTFNRPTDNRFNNNRPAGDNRFNNSPRPGGDNRFSNNRTGGGDAPRQGGFNRLGNNTRPTDSRFNNSSPQRNIAPKTPPKPAAVRPATSINPQLDENVNGKVIRHVDMRAANIELDKYNERYEQIAPENLAKRDDGVKKQKFAGRNKRKNFMSKKDREIEKMRKLELERDRRQKLNITLPDEITVGDLALKLKIQAAEIIKRLMTLGEMKTVTDIIDYDTAALVAIEIGAKVEREVVVTIEDRLFSAEEDTDDAKTSRPPVVVVMGHVDHGKTSILDAIRHAEVTSTEAGGITQHIGAYQVSVSGKPITFLDTPGHEAFTSMRARGADITDIAILVVAADDGIMPQTVESINHAKAAGISIIVAINKMDKPSADSNKVKQELTEYSLVPEEWGGDVVCVPVSAKTKEGIPELLEMVQIVADVKELRANPDRMAQGTVIEAKLDKGRGPVATILVQNGTLRTGDAVIAGTAVGRVRVMTNDKGEKIDEAGPSMPVEITGLAEVPAAGDEFNAVEDEKLARELVEQRRQEAKEKEFSSYQKVTLDNLFEQIEVGETKELPLIVKADVQGSVEAVKQSLEKLSTPEVRVRVIHGAVGAVNKSDVMLAEASGAIVIGFNVRPDPVARDMAALEGVDIRLYRVIYTAIEEVSSSMKGMLAPKIREVELGRAEVREVFKITNVGTVAGCYVLEGKITRNAEIRIVRDGIIVADEHLTSLKRFKDDVKEVAKSYECGMGIEKFGDLKTGDIFEAYIIEEYRD